MKRIFLLLILFYTCIYSQSKINGISFVASNREISQLAINHVIAVNANWVTLMPYAFMKNTSDTAIIFNSKKQWLGERKEGIEKTALLFRKNKIKIMLKPQIWIPNGGFTGNIIMKNELDWIKLEKNYSQFILFYAKIAQENNMELLCIGTELHSFVINRPQYWKKLINQIKKIYSGNITYAENWDTFDQVPFLPSLNYIGVDDYFPISSLITPNKSDLIKNWQPIKKRLKDLSKKHDKKIVFTEFGYQSKNYTTLKPWEHGKKSDVNLEGQKLALQALFHVFWNEKWFEGGFLWKWYDNHNQVGGLNDTDYTVQNKPSENIVKNQYSKKKTSK